MSVALSVHKILHHQPCFNFCHSSTEDNGGNRNDGNGRGRCGSKRESGRIPEDIFYVEELGD